MAIFENHLFYNPFLVYCRELVLGTASSTGDQAQGDDSKHDSHYTPDFSYEWIHFLVIVINIDLIFYLLNTALYNHIYSSIFVHMKDIFSPKTILKPNTSLFESLPLFSSVIFFLFIDFALRDFCTFRKLRPSICMFNLTSASGEISVIIC